MLDIPLMNETHVRQFAMESALRQGSGFF